jgi:integrase
MGDIIRKKKNGKDLGWYIRWTENGKRRQRASHQPSYVLAKRMLLEIEARVARGMAGIIEPDERQQLTVSQLCERFLKEYASPKVKNFARYRQFAASRLRRILPHIGEVRLGELNKAHVVKARDALGKKYPPGTTRTTLIPLMAAFSWAVKQGLLDRNPAHGVERPPSPNAQLDFLSAEDVSRLVAEATCRVQKETGAAGLLWHSRQVAVVLAVYTGMRKGEIFGLRWQDVNLDTGRLTIAHSYESTPKSGRARHLRLPSTLVPILREWREKCPPTARGLICPILDKGRWHMSMSASKMHGLPDLLKAARCQVVGRCWHMLRHTFASHYMMAGGSLLALSKILGHSSMTMTMIYAHLAPDYLDREMERVKFEIP